MLKKIFNLAIFFFLMSNFTIASENLNLKYIDLNFIINNSIIGEKVKDNLKNKNEIINKDHTKIEKNLKTKKDELISQKNILEKSEFEKKVLAHQQKVQDYQDKVKKDLNELGIDRSKMTNQLLKKIDKILLEYVENNKIDMIVKKESLIISNSKWDITNIILKNLDSKYKSIE